MCGKLGHVAKNCWNYTISKSQHPMINMEHTGTQHNTTHDPWILDNGATTHAMSNIRNLLQYTEYGGPE